MKSPRAENLTYIHNNFSDRMLPYTDHAANNSNMRTPLAVNVQLVPQANGEDFHRHVIPTKKQAQQGPGKKDGQSGGNVVNIRASDEINSPTRWDKIVNNRMGKAKMNLILD